MGNSLVKDSELGLGLIFYVTKELSPCDQEIDYMVDIYKTNVGNVSETLDLELKKIITLKELFEDIQSLDRRNVVNVGFELCDHKTILDLINNYLPEFQEYNLGYEIGYLTHLIDQYQGLSEKKEDIPEIHNKYEKLKSKLTKHNDSNYIALRQAWHSLDNVIERATDCDKYELEQLKKQFGQDWLTQLLDLMEQKYIPENDILN